jgi:uncharacterized membrane protein
MTLHKLALDGVLALMTALLMLWTSTPAMAQSRPADKAAAGKSVKIDMNKIFPPGPGRNLVLSDCTSCHTITPIVIIQMTREARERWARDHRERVNAMSNEDFKLVTEYLIKHFSPGQPIPQLPKELLDTWTSY